MALGLLAVVIIALLGAGSRLTDLADAGYVSWGIVIGFTIIAMAGMFYLAGLVT
jgi:hypothetical protein